MGDNKRYVSISFMVRVDSSHMLRIVRRIHIG